MSDQNKELFERVFKLWTNGESKSTQIDKLFNYWNGYSLSNPTSKDGQRQPKTNCNIVNEIVEAKLTAMFDAQFTASVVPEVYSFADMGQIKNLQAVADVIDKALKDVLNKNRIDTLKEHVARWGFISFGASQVYWNTINDDGEIKLSVIDPRNLRWNRGAKNPEDLTFVAYSTQVDINILKKNYARMPDGSYDIELCKQMDKAAKNPVPETKSDNKKGVGAWQVDQATSQAGLGYIKETVARQPGQVADVVVMFLFDNTLSVPENTDTEEDIAEKQEIQAQFPNGRIITFLPDNGKKIILEDKPAPKAFKNLGNIDFFNTIAFEGFDKGGEVENLVPVQDRINGAYKKLRGVLGGHINTVILEEKYRGLVADDSFVNYPLVFLEGISTGYQPTQINNNGIAEAVQVRQLIEAYKQEAYEIARVNRAWVTGENQQNVQSGEHADALIESAMQSIRSIQRNFKDYFVSVCEKIVALIIENYTPQQLIEISTGLTAKQYAMIDTVADEQGNEHKNIKFIDEVGNIVNEIKFDPEIALRVEVTSGTEIPRSRRESANLIDRVIASPVMQSGDIDMIDMYLTAQDFPNRRAIVDMLRQKQAQKAQNPQPILQQLMANPALLTAWGNLFKDLSGYPSAQGQLLRAAGLDGTAGTIASLPASEVTAKSQAKDIALIAPSQISENQDQANFGHQQSTELEVIDKIHKGSR